MKTVGFASGTLLELLNGVMVNLLSVPLTAPRESLISFLSSLYALGACQNYIGEAGYVQRYKVIILTIYV